MKHMKVIIADTSCLIVLTKIGSLDLLKMLFEKVTITPIIASEYLSSLPIGSRFKYLRQNHIWPLPKLLMKAKQVQ